MAQSFQELVFGDVQVAPFVAIAALAFVILLLLRPMLARIGFHRAFRAPAAAMLSLYILILALLVVEV
jgi:hypothetical protein